jgi:BirA family biotin operon repressor/biotin-[acetyl-CoA-carboxylase] ligase
MSLIQGTDFCVNKVGRVFVDEFLRLYNLFLQGGDDALLAEYEQLLMGRQTAMLYRDSAGVFEATVHGVESDGRIGLMRGDGQLSYYSFKEVQMVSLGY